MNSNSLNFDTIIFSANLAGIVTALKSKTEGEKVLLLNRYGFFGGTLTESLNLYQRKILTSESKSDFLNKILKQISLDKDGILFEDDDYFILNPEVVKYKLQKICEEYNVELLFHITPYKVEFKDDEINLLVIGREGEIKLKCKRLFDFSTEFSFAPLIDKSSRIFLKSFVNFITLPVPDESIFDDTYRKIKLNDKRWWISLEHNNLNLTNVEFAAQESLDLFDKKLRDNGSRIQIVPAQSNLIFDFKRTDKFNKRIYFLTDFIHSFNPEDELIIANSIEKVIDEII